MTNFTHNIAPARARPLDCRGVDGSQLSRESKLAALNLLSETERSELRELLAMAANVRQPPAAPRRADEFYSMNSLLDHTIGTTDGDLVRLATEVQTLIRGANGVKMTALGETQLKALKAHFEQA